MVTLAQGAGGHSTITTVSGTTDASGQATFSVADATAEAVTYTATDTRQSRSKVVNAATDVPLLNAYRPVKARIVSDD